MIFLLTVEKLTTSINFKYSLVIAGDFQASPLFFGQVTRSVGKVAFLGIVA